MTKKLVTISIFIFWAVAVAVLTAGLVYYQDNKAQNCQSASLPSSPSGQQITLTIDEISKHNTGSDCWLLINNKVYNVTSFLFQHPGGAGTITPHCGKEATNAFNTKDVSARNPHSSFAASLLTNYYIGDLNQKISGQTVNVPTVNIPPTFDD